MKSLLRVVTAVLALCTEATLAHYKFTALIVNGTVTGDYVYVRENTDYNFPVTDVTSKDLTCNVGTLGNAAKTKVATVLAGSKVGFKTDIPIFHQGPMMVYLGKVPTGTAITSWDGSGTVWFKIAELGAIISPTSMGWYSMNLTSYNFTIPATTPPGNYLLRIEHVGLHVASTVGGAQFYMSCAQITINGKGGGNPAPKAAIPGYYKATDPGLLINIYWPVPQNYTIPGPPVWKG